MPRWVPCSFRLGLAHLASWLGLGPVLPLQICLDVTRLSGDQGYCDSPVLLTLSEGCEMGPASGNTLPHWPHCPPRLPVPLLLQGSPTLTALGQCCLLD